MKTVSLCFVLLTSVLLAQAPVDLSKAWIYGETNQSALSYEPGEEMVFTFQMKDMDTTAPNLFLAWDRKGDDGAKMAGKVPISQKAVVKTKLDKTGFVSVNVTLVDEKGKRVLQPFTRWNKTIGKRPVSYFAGAAVHPEKLTDCGEPADFDQFWVKQRQRLAQVPFAGKVTLTKVRGNQHGDVYAFSIPCAGPRPATGYLNVPKNAKPKSLPAAIYFHGYGNHIQRASSPNPHSLTMILNAHGQKLEQPPEYYKKFFESIKSNGKSYAFDPIQNANPETAFFNGMCLRIIRALEYLKSRPEWNGKKLVARGGSQGGLQTMWAAALDQDVTHAYPAITWCCDLAGTAKKQRLCGGWRIKYVPALDYYDPVFMAKRIKNCQVEITRAGLGDYCCPPSGVTISYLNIASPRKSIRFVQGSDHGFVPKKSEVILWSTMKDKK